MQTKKQKREKVLGKLLDKLSKTQRERLALQRHADYIIPVTMREINISIEISNLKRKLGQ